MIAAWILYSILAGVLIAAGAWALSSAARVAALPTRWIWAVALGATVALAASAPLRAREARGVELRMPSATQTEVAAPSKHAERFGDRVAVVAATLSRRTVDALASVANVAAGTPARWLVVAWIALSAAALTLLVAVHARFGRLRRRWPVAELAGSNVRVAPDVGPAVIGVARPEIVVPVWLLERTEHEQALVVAHEAEHVRSRDPALLGFAWLLVALVPWNLAAWWMLSRLRLAVELDCDARVLRRGVAPRAYGSLLIDLAGRCAGFPAGAPALADTPSHLERRLVAMRPDRPRFPLLRAAGAGALALVAVLAACEARMPTQDDVTSMDAAKAEQVAGELTLAKVAAEKQQAANVKFYVDDRPATAEEARAISAAHISTVNIAKAQTADGSAIISIHTNPVVALRMRLTPEDSAKIRQMMLVAAKSGAAAGTTSGAERARAIAGDAPAEGEATMVLGDPKSEPLVYIDGVRATHADLGRLDRSQIATVNVLKNEAAREQYGAVGAAHGVIQITTVKGAKK